MCNNCGNMSADYNMCDACKKELPDSPKYYLPEKVLRLEDGQKAFIGKQQFYGKGQ